MGTGDDRGDPGPLAGVGQQAVRLGQVLGGSGPVDQDLDPAELDEQRRALLGRHRLLQRAPEHQHRRVRGAARDRRPRGGAQHLDGRRAAASGRAQQVGGHLFGRCALPLQEAGGPLVVQRPLARRQVVVDGFADQRMDEAETVLVGEDLSAAQGVERGGDLGLGPLREGRDRRQLGGVAEHRDRPGRCRDLGGQPAQPQRDQRRHRPRPHRAHGVDVGHVGRDPLVLQRPQQLAQQQRVARGHPVAGVDEGVRALAEPLADQRARRLRRQRGRPQHDRRGVERDLGEQGVVGVVLAGAHRRARRARAAPRAA